MKRPMKVVRLRRLSWGGQALPSTVRSLRAIDQQRQERERQAWAEALTLSLLCAGEVLKEEYVFDYASDRGWLDYPLLLVAAAIAAFRERWKTLPAHIELSPALYERYRQTSLGEPSADPVYWLTRDVAIPVEKNARLPDGVIRARGLLLLAAAFTSTKGRR